MVTTRTSASRRIRACSATTARTSAAASSIPCSRSSLLSGCCGPCRRRSRSRWRATTSPFPDTWSGLTWPVGRPLIALNGERYAREAEFRFALVRVNESGESIALHGGEKDEQRHLEAALAAVVDTMRRISTSLAHLTWITSGTGWLSVVVPILVAAPAYFSGRLTLGGLIMVAGAFSQVQAAMRWFVDNFSRLADWRAAVHRVARFREALDGLPAVEEGAEEIKRGLHPDGLLTFDGVRILLPDGHIIIEDSTVSIVPGDRVLIVGETGRGKSTIFRAVAGLWPWGSGTILTPPPGAMAFLPQRPY